MPSSRRNSTVTGSLSIVVAMTAVGSSIVVASRLANYPVLTGQAVRYGLAALILSGVARRLGVAGRSMPRHVRWRLVALAAVGLAGFNIVLILARERAEPAVVAVVVGAVPVVLALASPLSQRRPPTARLVVAGTIITIGTGFVVGSGHASTSGVALAIVALACEAAFTLLAVPVLRDVPPVMVALHSCSWAAVLCALFAPVVHGRDAFRIPSADVGAVLVYLAVVVTAVAFVCWYHGVALLGAERAGLFAGLMPIAAAALGSATGETTITVGIALGTAVVAAGLVVGLSSSSGRHRPDDPVTRSADSVSTPPDGSLQARS